MRVSSRAIIFKDNQVLLIYRERNNETYYVFPGGKIEENETKEECIIRECKEELGIDVSVEKYVYEVKGQEFVQHFFLCKWKSGMLGTGDINEYDPNRKGGLQKPCMIDLKDINKLNIVSPQIIEQLSKDIESFGLKLDDKVKEIIEN